MRNLLGIIGKPLGHSLSPLLHNKAIEKLEANYKYESWELDHSELEQFLKRVKENESLVSGFNVTIPYKEEIMNFLDELDPLASKLKAVNTVKYENGKLKGYNTDGLGLLETLNKNNVKYENKNILILGSGGACKGVALFLANKNIGEIDIVARNIKEGSFIRDELIKMEVPSKFILWENLSVLDVEEYQIIIQTTPIGMKENDVEIDFPYSKLTSRHTMLDIIYNPIETKFLKSGKKYGASCINGLEMLVYQGFYSFKIWTGLEEDTDLMLEVALEKLGGKCE